MQRKLQREYKRLSQLTQFIFWTSIGKEGALHFKEQLRQKRMAEQLRESVASGLSVEKTQKMIRRFVRDSMQFRVRYKIVNFNPITAPKSYQQ